MVNKKHTVQVIDLMFHTDRFDAGACFFEKYPALILPAETDPAVSLQKSGVIRKAHTAFLARFGFLFFQDHRIHKDETLSPWFTPRDIHEGHRFGDADLRRRDTDPMGLTFHRTDQHRDEPQQ